MSLEDLLDDRYSCRAYLREPVPEAVVDQMFAVAQRTPSWCNAQPWQVHLISGEATEQFAKELTAHVAAGGAISSDLRLPGGYSGVHGGRRRESHRSLNPQTRTPNP